MKSHLLSDGKKYPFVSRLVLLCLWSSYMLIGTSCASSEDYETSTGYEVSIADDKSEIEDLRKNIPKEKRLRNDQLKELLKLMGVVKDSPSRIRSKFNNIHRKRRDHFRKSTAKRRAQFRKAEKLARDRYLKKAKKKRDEFTKRVRDKDERKAFFAEQDQARKEYFDEERDRRKEFEAVARQKSKDFYAEQREQRREFSAELRVYTKRYNDMKKEKKKRRKAKRTNTGKNFRSVGRSQMLDDKVSKDMEPFEKLDKVPGTRLGTDDN